MYFEEGRYPDGNSDFVAESFEQLAEHYRETCGGDLYERYRSIGLDPDDLVGRPVYKDGLFTHVKGIGWVVDAYQRAQVSLNLTNYKVAAPHDVLEAARDLAAERGIVVTGSEIVGVVPFDAMRRAGRFYLQRMRKSTGVPAGDLVTTASQAMGLGDVADFDIDRKVIGMPKASGPLAGMQVDAFVDEVSRDTPAPGGGSIAALAGAMGAALASMVANLSIGKGEYDDRYEKLCGLAERAQAAKDELVRAIDADTEAFNEVIAGMRMPKDTAEQITVRAGAIQESELTASPGHEPGRLQIGRGSAAAHRSTVPRSSRAVPRGSSGRQRGRYERCGRGRPDGVRGCPGRHPKRPHQSAPHEGPGAHRLPAGRTR